jgi:hypothetical protein
VYVATWMSTATARRHSAPSPTLGVDVDEGLVLLGAWAEMGAVVAVVAYFILRQRGPDR